ncbi:hypothetical protein [Streptodolium elevatio]|uniref:Uncharacterized protein n=1 Tax=Streptodolium elevatio TaxID=3157996 RepID=A0ABV3DA69_9ACTN
MTAVRRLVAVLFALFLVAAAAQTVQAAPAAQSVQAAPALLPQGNNKNPKCVYVAEDINGFAFTYYCPGPDVGEFLHSENDYYVNWDEDSDNYKKPGPPGSKHGLGQPCDEDDRRWKPDLDCLGPHDWTGIGEWLRGQGAPGLVNGNSHRLVDMDNPCLTLKDGAADLFPRCPDPTEPNANPCSHIKFDDEKETKETVERCNREHPWFSYSGKKPPPPKAECPYVEGPVSEKCADKQIVGSGAYKAPAGVVGPMKTVLGYAVALVAVFCLFGLLRHLFVGISRYNHGDALGEVIGSMTWSLVALAGAPFVTWAIWAAVA